MGGCIQETTQQGRVCDAGENKEGEGLAATRRRRATRTRKQPHFGSHALDHIAAIRSEHSHCIRRSEAGAGFLSTTCHAAGSTHFRRSLPCLHRLSSPEGRFKRLLYPLLLKAYMSQMHLYQSPSYAIQSVSAMPGRSQCCELTTTRSVLGSKR